MKNLLYLSCHITAEADDLEILSNLGFSCVSIGNFILPKEPAHTKNLSLTEPAWTRHDWKEPKVVRNHSLAAQFLEENTNFNGITPLPPNVTGDFLNKFDVIFISGFVQKLDHIMPLVNLDKTKVIFNTVGQTDPRDEHIFKKFRNNFILNRYSPTEARIAVFGGGYSEADSHIHGSVNEDFGVTWTGEEQEVITVARAAKIRARAVNYPVMLAVLEPLSGKIYGQGNEDIPNHLNGGALSYNQLIKAYTNKRCFLATGVCPGPVCYSFLEAMYVGIPVVALGHSLATKTTGNANFYDIPSYINNEVDGFFSNNIDELKHICSQLLNNYALALKISKAATEKARSTFSREAIQNKWKNLFIKHGIL